jgi:hypothetical protein
MAEKQIYSNINYFGGSSLVVVQRELLSDAAVCQARSSYLGNTAGKNALLVQ